jgi:hypothetical protein
MSEPTKVDSADSAALRQLVMGFRATQMIYVAAKLGIADHLEAGPQGADALAKAIGAAPRPLYRLLRLRVSGYRERGGYLRAHADGAAAAEPARIAAQQRIALWRRGVLVGLWGDAAQRTDRGACLRASRT